MSSGRFARLATRWLGLWAGVGVGVGVGGGVCHAAPVAEIPTFEAVRAAWQPADVLITDRQGVIMQRVRRDLQVRRLGWVRLDAPNG